MFISMGAYANIPGYSYFKTITIQSSQVSGVGGHIDFPILIYHTDLDLRTTSNGGRVTDINGFDIQFTLVDGNTVLEHDLEDYNAVTGEVAVWVKVPNVSTLANTVIRIYYGNSAITTNQSSTATWDTNYKGVYHLHNNDLSDGTVNANNLTNSATLDFPNSVVAGGRDLNASKYMTATSDAS